MINAGRGCQDDVDDFTTLEALDHAGGVGHGQPNRYS
jgi:hypothetical protein